MKILVDINHPAHVHYFKNCIQILRAKGHQFIITSRNRYPALQLLDAYNETYYNRGKGFENLWGKLFYMPIADIRILKIALKTKPHLFLSFGTPYPNHVAWILRKPGINFQDTENAGLMNFITKPFSQLYCTPSCFKKNLGKRHIRFDGYMELAYLHPNYFKPDDSVFKYLEIGKREKYMVLRFVSWGATHDIGHKGIHLHMKRKAVKEFSKLARVYISSEAPLPDDLKTYQIHIPPDKMHHVLAFASLLYGESATMASECAMLGTPAIYIDNEGRGYTDELEKKYGLVFNYSESLPHQEESIGKAFELLKRPNLSSEWQKRRQNMLDRSIDVTHFMVQLIEKFPDDSRLIKDDREEIKEANLNLNKKTDSRSIINEF